MSDPTQMSKSYWQRNKYLVIGLSVLIVVAAAAGTVTFINWETNQRNNTETVSVKSQPTTKPIESKDIKTLASARLKQLTGGVELETITEEAVKSETGNNSGAMYSPTTPISSQSQLPVVGGGALTGSSDRQSTVIIDQAKAEEIVNNNEINDTTAFYHKSKTSIFNYQENTNPYYGYGSNIDYSKPIETENWTSANYYKAITRQDGKIIDFYINTPDYYLTFVGGKYAVKENYSSRQYFGGIYEGKYENPELSFLKYILSEDSNMKPLGRQTVDGKDLLVYEYRFDGYIYAEGDSSSLMPTYVTRYYIDDANFVLYLVENYENDKLVYQSKNLDSQELSGEGVIKQVYNSQEISNVPVKETTLKTYEYNPEDYLLQKFIKKYDLFYSDQIDSSFVSASDYSMWQNQEYTDLVFNQDFNPYLSDEYISYFKNFPVASYYQEYTSYEIRTSPVQTLGKWQTVENSQPITVILGDQEVEGRSFELVYDYGDGNQYRTYYVEFQIGVNWYSINQWDLNYAPVQLVKQNPLKLVKMTPERAQEIDLMMAPSVQYPEYIPIGDGIGDGTDGEAGI